MKSIEILRTNLRRLRLSAGLTQQEFAEKTRLTYKYYQDLEAGRLSGVTLATVDKFATFHKVEVWKLFHPELIPEASVKRARAQKIVR